MIAKLFRSVAFPVVKPVAMLMALTFALVAMQTAEAGDPVPAKELFGVVKLPSRGQPQPDGFYAKGCLSGGVAIPMDGPNWQVLHPSRNRRWGHPQMISLLERLSRDAAEKDGWPGLLIGDISQPRGGPMLTGHSSHQIGLDADIWLTPMPSHKLSVSERENMPENSVLKDGVLRVDPNKWSAAHAAVIMRAASYPQVERIFVHPGIKKKLCDTWKGDRANLGKVRPYYGHHYHFHIRIKCPAGARNCESQTPVGYGDGCGKELAWWLSDAPWGKPRKPGDKPVKPAKPHFIKMAELPKSCAMVLKAPAVPSEMQAVFGEPMTAMAAPSDVSQSDIPIVASGTANPDYALPDYGPMPLVRPFRP